MNLIRYCFLLILSLFWTFIIFLPPSLAEEALRKQKPFRVGCILYLTGDLAMQENAFREGLEIARDEILQAGGIGGRPLELIVEDTKNDPKLGVNASQKFLSVDKIDAALLSSYQDAMSSGPLYEAAKIPAIVLWDASPEIDAAGDFLFSIGPWIPSAGEAAADFIFGKLGKRKAVSVYTEEQWSNEVHKYFQKRFESLGGTLLRSISAPAENADFKTIVTKLRREKAEALYAPLTYQILPFYKRLRAQGWTLPIVSSDIITEELVRQDPAIFENVYQTGIQDPTSKDFKELSRRYEIQFHKELTLPWFVATGYDALKILARAAERTSQSHSTLQQELYSVQNFPGAARTYSINSAGSSPDYEHLFQIREGKFHPID